jgi:hypothetical protein
MAGCVVGVDGVATSRLPSYPRTIPPRLQRGPKSKQSTVLFVHAIPI